MTERDNRAPITDRRGGLSQQQAVTDPAIDELDNEQVQRWAKLIVEGDESSLAHLSADNRERIESDVRRQLRARLMRMIARTIAQDIMAEQSQHGA